MSLPRHRQRRLLGPLSLITLVGVAALGASLVQPSAPNDFWLSFLRPGAVEVERYASLDRIVRSSDAVVVGRIVSVRPGREFGEPGIDMVHYAAATVAVDEVLAGTVIGRGPELILELQMPHGQGASDVSALASRVPASQHVLFLRNKGVEVARAGLAEVIVERETPFYRTVTSAAYLVERQGRVDAPGVTDHDSFLLALEGRDFREVVASIRSCADRGC